MNKLHQKNKESFQNPKKSSLKIFKNGFKTIRRIVPLDTAYRASRNGVSSTAVRWRAKVLAFLPLRPRRLPAPTGKASRFLRQVRTEHRAQFSRGRYRRCEKMSIKFLLYIIIYNKVIFTTFYCSSENCALCSVRIFEKNLVFYFVLCSLNRTFACKI